MSQVDIYSLSRLRLTRRCLASLKHFDAQRRRVDESISLPPQARHNALIAAPRMRCR